MWENMSPARDESDLCLRFVAQLQRCYPELHIHSSGLRCAQMQLQQLKINIEMTFATNLKQHVTHLNKLTSLWSSREAIIINKCHKNV